MRFRYEAHDRAGNPRKGEIEATNEEDASGKLRYGDLFVLSLEAAGPEPQKTVLNHDKVGQVADFPPDVREAIEDEIEAMESEDLRTTFKDQVILAVEVAEAIREAMEDSTLWRDEADRVAQSALEEMLAELAIRKLHERIGGR